MKKLAILLLVSASAFGQTFISPSGAARRFVKVNGVPAACSTGDVLVNIAVSPAVYYSCPVTTPVAFTTTTNATTVTTTSVSNNAEYHPLFVSSTTNSNQAVKLNAGAFTYNPSTDTLSVSNVAGQSTSAVSAATANGSTGDFAVGGRIDFSTGTSSLLGWNDGTGPTFTDSTGDSLQWAISLVALTPATLRTVTAADASGTMVLDTATQTLTNKTMTDAKTGGVTPAVSNTTANSCGTTTATITGNNTTGVVTVGATAGTNCTITFTVAAPTRRQCTANNETTGNLTRATYLTTTTSTVEGTFVAGDKISYICAVY